ncbi:hypothetical protein AAC387_Pa05g0825 [Persea americana]
MFKNVFASPYDSNEGFCRTEACSVPGLDRERDIASASSAYYEESEASSSADIETTAQDADFPDTDVDDAVFTTDSVIQPPSRQKETSFLSD